MSPSNEIEYSRMKRTKSTNKQLWVTIDYGKRMSPINDNRETMLDITQVFEVTFKFTFTFAN